MLFIESVKWKQLSILASHLYTNWLKSFILFWNLISSLCPLITSYSVWVCYLHEIFAIFDRHHKNEDYKMNRWWIEDWNFSANIFYWPPTQLSNIKLLKSKNTLHKFILFELKRQHHKYYRHTNLLWHYSYFITCHFSPFFAFSTWSVFLCLFICFCRF